MKAIKDFKKKGNSKRNTYLTTAAIRITGKRLQKELTIHYPTHSERAA